MHDGRQRMFIVFAALFLLSGALVLYGTAEDRSGAETIYEDGAWTYVVDGNGNAVIVDWYWKADNNGLEDGTLTIPGTLKADNDVIRTVTEIRGTGSGDHNKSYFMSANGSMANVLLPATVRTLSSGTFHGCSGITDIDLSNITHIGQKAFKDCTSLTNVTMPNSVFSLHKHISDPPPQPISADAFRGCTSLESIDLGNLEEGGMIADFEGCTSLETVMLPTTAYGLGNSAFRGCTSLESIDVSNAVSVGGFRGCTSLSNIEMPDAQYELRSNTFDDCSSLNTLDLKNVALFGNVKNFFIGSGIEEFIVSPASPYKTIDGVIVSGDEKTLVAFPPAKTTDYRVPNGITTIGPSAFQSSPIVTVDLNQVTFVGENAFGTYVSFNPATWKGPGGCQQLETVVSPNLEKMGMYAFAGCESLESIDLSKVSEVAENAISLCPSLRSVDVSRIADIGDMFYECTGIEEFTAVSSSLYVSVNGILYDHDMDALLRVPPTWTETHFTVPGGISIVGDKVFKDYVKLETVDISNVMEMGDETFSGCTSLRTVTISQFVSIGNGTFSRCTSLTTIDLSMITHIGDQAFYGCTSLQSVDMTAATHIGNEAFRGCGSFTNAIAPVAEHIGGGAFRDCGRLLVADVSSAKTIGGYAFLDCSNLISVDLSSVTEIRPYGAFWGCSKLTTVKMPSTPYTIANSTFGECISLESIDLGGATFIDFSAFSGCVKLSSVTALNVTEIMRNAFVNTNISYLNMPNLVIYESPVTVPETLYAPKLVLSGYDAYDQEYHWLNDASMRRVIVSSVTDALDTEKKCIPLIFITSDYYDGVIPLDFVDTIKIYRHADASGWENIDGVGTFRYVTYMSDGGVLMVNAVPDGEATRQLLFLDEGRSWMLDGQEYNFAKAVTSDLVLTVGTVYAPADGDDGSEERDTGKILAAIGAVAAIMVVAVIFLMRRPA